MDHVHIVVLACHHCERGASARGDLRRQAAGLDRLLQLRAHDRQGPAELRRAYLTDVEHRVTKPRRMLRRVIRHPVAFALDLPGALLVKPAKMEAELRVLYGRR